MRALKKIFGSIFAGGGFANGKNTPFQGKKEAVRKEHQEKSESEAVSEEQILTPLPEERYTLLAEDTFNLHTKGCILTGILKGGVLSIRDKVWILRADGTQKLVKVVKIEAFQEEQTERVVRASGDTRIGILVPNIR